MDFNGNQTVQGTNESFSARVLDKTLIHRLVSFKKPFESALKLSFGTWTVWFPLKKENPGMLSSKTLISFRLKKERRGHLGWHGGE